MGHSHGATQPVTINIITGYKKGALSRWSLIEYQPHTLHGVGFLYEHNYYNNAPYQSHRESGWVQVISGHHLRR